MPGNIDLNMEKKVGTKQILVTMYNWVSDAVVGEMGTMWFMASKWLFALRNALNLIDKHPKMKVRQSCGWWDKHHQDWRPARGVYNSLFENLRTSLKRDASLSSGKRWQKAQASAECHTWASGHHVRKSGMEWLARACPIFALHCHWKYSKKRHRLIFCVAFLKAA